MNNFYKDFELNTTEYAIALENFDYNTKVKCYIPSLMSFLPSSEVVEDSKRNSSNNIKNKNKNLLGIGQVNTCNYIELYIPSLYSNGDIYGKKGTKFLITFVAGDINKCKVIGRSY